LLGSFQFLDEEGKTRAIFRRVGTGLRVLVMNFVLEDATHGPLLFIRQPPARSGVSFGRPFALLPRDGTLVGLLRMKGGLHPPVFTREQEGQEPIEAEQTSRLVTNYDVRQGPRTLASARSDLVAFPGPGGIRIHLPLAASDRPPRPVILAFVAYVTQSLGNHRDLPVGSMP
jgi:hypothetical protein